ncbi:MAG: NTP transferase domain-containing protein [Candidatus Heimdallarchaeota archaeon]|nr:NTP transferase domain-containing protein [Candidatus Heimdallarchaeota archaeon]
MIHQPKCVIILCAGKGNRLKPATNYCPKPLVLIRGRPIISYLIENYLWNDFEEFVFVIGHKGKTMQKRLEQLHRKYRKKYPDKEINFHLKLNDHVSRGNGYSGYLGLRKVLEENLGDQVMLSMGDHLYSHNLIKHMCYERKSDDDIIIATDPNLDSIYVDVEEATKIMGDKKGNVVNIGKEINQFNRIDMGVFILRTKIVQLIDKLDEEEVVFGWTDVVRKTIEKGLIVRYCDTTEQEWVDIDNIYDYTVALSLLEDITTK